MSKQWKPHQTIKETTTLKVIAVGTGLALYLPKAFREQYDIIGGDRIKVQLQVHYKRNYGEEGGSE